MSRGEAKESVASKLSSGDKHSLPGSRTENIGPAPNVVRFRLGELRKEDSGFSERCNGVQRLSAAPAARQKSIAASAHAVTGICDTALELTHSIRQASLLDVRAISNLFQSIYGSSTHPCCDESYVEMLLSAADVRMVVAVSGQEVIGCAAATRMPVPGVVSPCYLAVRTDFRRAGYSRRIYTKIIQSALLQTDCDLLLQLPRSIATYRLVKRSMTVPVNFFGHDGGMNIAHGVREYHAIAFGINSNKVIRRALPPKPLRAVERRVSGMPILLTAEAKVKAWSVNSIENPSVPGISPSCVQLETPSPQHSLNEVLRCIDAQLDQNISIEHHFIAVPVEKSGFLHGLYRRGFRATAWLPAWHPEYDVRHDCVLMVRRCSRPPEAHGLKRLIEAWDKQLSTIGREP